MATQQREVQAFFDRIAGSYNDRFQPQRQFHHYFFHQRLAKAIEGIDFSHMKVLDIGAGTGPLYELIAEADGLDYLATDISGAMLEQSQIPADRRLVGNLDELELPAQRFDFVFALGVTTYLDDEGCRSLLDRAANLLKPGGLAIVSFTQSGSIDHYARLVIGWPVRLFRSEKHVMGQRFSVNRYRPIDIRRLCPNSLKVADLDFLNQTVFPFNRVFERASIGLAHFLENKLSNRTKALLSSDFLVRLKKR